MKDFTDKYIAKEDIYQKKVDNGEITQEQFDNWKKGQVFQGQQWKAKREQVVHVLNNSNQVALDMINHQTAGIFAYNASYMNYSLEHGAGVNFGFGLYDVSTVNRLIANNPQMLPEWKINEKKDYIWNEKKVNNAVTQGIIQGEKLDQITKRISEGLCAQNENLMKTFSRTAMTGAQNAGRLESLTFAKDAGIDVYKQWMATLDSHTRDSHADVDGESVPVDSKFSNGLEYPGEPGGAPAEVYNCRCTMVGDLKKYPAKYQRYDNINGKPIKNMTYREWERAKKSTVSKPVSTVVNGKDISQTWVRRPDQFAFEIEDVINAQGFDGLPKVVNAEEFDKYVKESNFIAQRAYSAPDQDTLNAYKEQLYNGKWYVDCSVGSGAYGSGMYAIPNYNGVIDKQMSEGMVQYRNRWGARPSTVETFTLTKDAKIITTSKLQEMKNELQAKAMEELDKTNWSKETMAKWDFISRNDNGVLAAKLGYDAIKVDIKSYGDYQEIIILNRTKCIFKGA